MAQREFYFQKRIFLGGGKFILQTKFYDFVAISLCGGKDYFCKKPIFNCGYSLKGNSGFNFMKER